MSPSIDRVLVEVGNTRTKVCTVRGAALNDLRVVVHDRELPWKQPALEELLATGRRWTLSGSNPPMVESFSQWLRSQGQQQVHVIDTRTKLPIDIHVDHPEKVGRDRLLNAIAVTQRPAVVISAGTAITVDAVSRYGHFLGGAIFPGLRLMADALHEKTASLPHIEFTHPRPALPAKNTEDAMAAGVLHAVAAGIHSCFSELAGTLEGTTTAYLTGGDGPVLKQYLPFSTIDAPLLTLQGILVVSQKLWP